jgi:2-hydroxy-3-oxopropionate reductase
MSRETSVGVIGLGNIGLPISLNLARKGVRTFVWNRSARSVDRVIKSGAFSVKSLAEFDCSIILTILPDISQVREVLNDGLLSALCSGDILVVMGTVSPIAIRELGKELEVLGISVVDAPVTGGDIGAQEGTLSIMVGGDKEDYEKLLPIFEKIGQTIRYFGLLGAGQIAKACNQIVVGSNLVAIAESLSLAKAYGLDINSIIEVVENGMGASRALTLKKDCLINRQFTPGGSVKYQMKDHSFIRELAESANLELPVSVQVLDLYKSHTEQGHGELDHSSIIIEIERRSKGI